MLLDSAQVGLTLGWQIIHDIALIIPLDRMLKMLDVTPPVLH